MKRICSCNPALLLMAVSLSAHAGTTTLSTGGVYGGSNQAKVYCYVFNVTLARDFFVQRAEIIRQDGSNVTSNATCDPGTHAPFGYLKSLGTCVISATAESGSTYSCRLTVLGDQGVKPNIRGTLDIRDVDDHVLTSSPLR